MYSSPLHNMTLPPDRSMRRSSTATEDGTAIDVVLSPSTVDPTPQSDLGTVPSQTVGVVNIINDDDHPVRRRATFSIPTTVQSAGTLGLDKLSISSGKHMITTVPGHKSQVYLDAPYPEEVTSRRDSAVFLADSSEDEFRPSPVLRPRYLQDPNLCTPIATPLKELDNPFEEASKPAPTDEEIEKAIKHEIEVPEISEPWSDELPFLEDAIDEVQQVAETMNSDDVMFYQSSMDQIASVFLPRELKTVAEQPEEASSKISISRKEDVVMCVIGVGYVGHELLTAFGGVFKSIGYDVSPARLEHIAPEYEHLPNVTLTSDVSQLSKGTHYLISVPTNLHKDNSVNATHLLTAITTVANYARPGSVVVIESSVSVGMTRAFLSKYSSTLYCGMSPERVDPGRASPGLTEIPKVISGLNKESLIKIHDVYSQVFDRVVPVSRPEVAEMTKLYENCFRMINIAYINEMSDACTKQGIDPHEVIDAAATKPFGFMPFRPGLGVGGHCIPINPHYLFVNNDLPVLAYASKRMQDRPAQLAQELFIDQSAILKTKLNSAPIKHTHLHPNAPRSVPRSHPSFSLDGVGSRLRILVIGVAFKPGQNVISCSPGLSFAAALADLGCRKLMFYDPLVPQAAAPWMRRLSSKRFTRKYLDGHFDVVAICMRQVGVDWDVLRGLKNAHVKFYYNEAS